MRSGSSWSEEFVKQLGDDEFREEYVADRVRTRLALLIRAIRENPDREWSQSYFAEKLGKRQSAVSRLEDPDYGKFTLQTLLEIAAAFRLPLYVDFPEWDEWMRLMKDAPTDALRRQGFDVAALCKPIHEKRLEDDLKSR